MTQLHDVVGYAAGFLATLAFVPQVTKTFKARSARDISLGMYVLFCAGILAGFLSRNDKICGDGKPPLRQRPDVALGHVVYQCHDGQLVTK